MQPIINHPSPQLIKELGKLYIHLKASNIKAYIIGGFLRDFLLNRKTSDIDIAVTKDPLVCREELEKVLNGKGVTLDAENKILRIILPQADSQSSNARMHFDLSFIEKDIEHDLGKRDFTINAMAVELGRFLDCTVKQADKLDILDPFNGTGDINAKKIRALNYNVFKNDPIRLVRAVRLAFDTGFAIEEKTEQQIKNDALLVKTSAQERVRDELLKLAELPFSENLWPYFDSLGLLTAIFPELELCRNVEQPREHTWPVLYHSINTAIAFNYIVRQGEWVHDKSGDARSIIPWSDHFDEYFKTQIGGYSRRVLVIISALLHDVAKPQTKTYDEESSRTRFTGHPKLGAETTLTILKRLRFSNKEIKLITSMVKNHLRPVQMSSDDEMPSQRAIYRYFRDDDGAGIDTLYLSLADHLATRGPNLEIANWQHHVKLVDYILSQHDVQVKRLKTPKKLIDGHDIMRAFGIKPGPKVKELLDALEEARANGEVCTKAQAITYIETLL